MRSEDIVKDQICFFSNSGKIITKIPYKDLERVANNIFPYDTDCIV